MKHKHCTEQPYDENSPWKESACNGSAKAAAYEADEDAFSYTDEEYTDEDDISEEQAAAENGKCRKSAERLALEKRFLALYEEFMHPTQEYSPRRIQYQADDLYTMLYQLNRGWAYRKAKSYQLAGFSTAEGEYALAAGFECIPGMLAEDRAAGKYCDYPIRHYLKIAQNKAIDAYFRHEFGRLPSKKKASGAATETHSPEDDEALRRRKVPYTVSLDAPVFDDHASYLGERLDKAAVDPFANPQRPRRERDEKANRLMRMFLQELMDYPDDPPKPLALMYGNILFQLYKDYGGNDTLSQMAKKSTKVSSPEWAHLRMGNATLPQLGIYSERIVRQCFGKSLAWGDAFNLHMLGQMGDGSGRKWADIIYTKTYTEVNTSHWIESIMKSTAIKCSRKMAGSPDLAEYAMETFGARNMFRKALEKTEKEDRR